MRRRQPGVGDHAIVDEVAEVDDLTHERERYVHLGFDWQYRPRTMRTRLTELLDIEHPIMLAGMGGVSYHRLVAAVSEAGGIGTLGASTMGTGELARRCRGPRAHRQAVRRRPPHGDPGQVERDPGRHRRRRPHLRRRSRRAPGGVDVLHDANILVGSMCGKVRHAVGAVASGCDFVVAQGTEAGGHTGTVATMALVPRSSTPSASRSPSSPPAGCTTARPRRRAGARGRRGVGRHPLHRHPEARSVAGYKETLLATPEDGTVISRAYTGKTCRVVRNDWTQHFEEHPRSWRRSPAQVLASARPASTTSAPPTARRSTRAASSSPAARASAPSTSWCPAGELVHRMMDEAEQALARAGRH